MGDVMDSAGVPHFSGLRLDALRLSSSTPSSPSSAMAASYSGSPYNLSSPVAAAKQPFVIGTYPLLLSFLSLFKREEGREQSYTGIHQMPHCFFIAQYVFLLEDN